MKHFVQTVEGNYVNLNFVKQIKIVPILGEYQYIKRYEIKVYFNAPFDSDTINFSSTKEEAKTYLSELMAYINE